MNNRCEKTKLSGALIAFLLVGFLFSLTVAAETDQNVAVSATATSNGIQFRVQNEGIESFQVSIFTANGKTLFKSGSISSNSVTWNFTDSTGNRVPFGIYLYQFVGKSSGGETTRGVAKILVGPNQVSAESVRTQSALSAKKDDLPNKSKNPSACTTIQSGDLTYSVGHYLEDEPLMIGYDPYGYNYQAHMFRGSYVNVYLGSAGFPPYEGNDEEYLEKNPEAENHWAWPYRDTHLIMKWNDAWLSDKDCDGDGKLDRHYGHDSRIGSGGWMTNHQSGGQGKDKWTYFIKIVTAPEGAYKEGGIWYTSDGTEIGPVIWGASAIVQEVESGEGAIYVSPAGPGLGKWKD